MRKKTRKNKKKTKKRKDQVLPHGVGCLATQAREDHEEFKDARTRSWAAPGTSPFLENYFDVRLGVTVGPHHYSFYHIITVTHHKNSKHSRIITVTHH